MASGCKDAGQVAAWCADIAGDRLDERRSELFWRLLSGRLADPVAREVEGHVQQCLPCRNALEAERALRAAAGSGEKIAYSVCPSSEELLELDRLNPWRRLEIRRHADQCRLCHEELGWARRLDEPPRARRFRWAWRWAWAPAAAAALVLVIATLYPS